MKFLQAFRCSMYFYLTPSSLSASQALMSLFVLASKDGWVDIMYDGLDAVGVDQQVRTFELSHTPTHISVCRTYTHVKYVQNTYHLAIAEENHLGPSTQKHVAILPVSSHLYV